MGNIPDYKAKRLSEIFMTLVYGLVYFGALGLILVSSFCGFGVGPMAGKDVTCFAFFLVALLLGVC